MGKSTLLNKLTGTFSEVQPGVRHALCYLLVTSMITSSNTLTDCLAHGLALHLDMLSYCLSVLITSLRHFVPGSYGHFCPQSSLPFLLSIALFKVISTYLYKSMCGPALHALISHSFSGSVFPQVAAYEFTTLTCVPGVVRYRGAKIQLLDLPGIIEGAKDGKGRGRQV